MLPLFGFARPRRTLSGILSFWSPDFPRAWRAATRPSYSGLKLVLLSKVKQSPRKYEFYEMHNSFLTPVIVVAPLR